MCAIKQSHYEIIRNFLSLYRSTRFIFFASLFLNEPSAWMAIKEGYQLIKTYKNDLFTFTPFYTQNNTKKLFCLKTIFSAERCFKTFFLPVVNCCGAKREKYFKPVPLGLNIRAFSGLKSFFYGCKKNVCESVNFSIETQFEWNQWRVHTHDTCEILKMREKNYQNVFNFIFAGKFIDYGTGNFPR